MDSNYLPFEEIDPRDSEGIQLFKSKAKRDAQIKRENINALYSILNNQQGEKLIEYWLETYVHTFIAQPNDTEIAVGIKQGQANFAMHIKMTIDQLNKGVDNG